MAKTMRHIAVFTGTRADYGILTPLLRAIQRSANLELQLLVSGNHFSDTYGHTIDLILADGFEVAASVAPEMPDDSAATTVNIMGQVMTGMAQHLARLKPDMLVVLGDRYEALAVVQAAFILHIPVVHLHGGEVTEGAYDDAIRHAITKLSQYHITATARYRQRVIQLGEAPDRVFNLGAPGLEVIRQHPTASRESTLKRLKLAPAANYALLTLHSETQHVSASGQYAEAVLNALLATPEMSVVCTYPNADEGGRAIIDTLHQFEQRYPERIRVFTSLGQAGYLDAVSHATLVIGNSSSAIIEVPSLHVPSVNVGQRQKGRLAATSVLHCEATQQAVTEAIAKAMAMDCSNVVNPYGDGQVSGPLVDLLARLPLHCQKAFFDFPGQAE